MGLPRSSSCSLKAVPAASIAIGGDSAGGGLTLATMIRLRDAGKPLPGCAWLVSPWVDLEMTGASMDEKDAVDPLIYRDYLEELAGAYLGGTSAREPLASPLHADLAGSRRPSSRLVRPRHCSTMQCGSPAGLGAVDVATSLEIWPHMIHAWHLWAARLISGREAIASAGAFINQHLTT